MSCGPGLLPPARRGDNFYSPSLSSGTDPWCAGRSGPGAGVGIIFLPEDPDSLGLITPELRVMTKGAIRHRRPWAKWLMLQRVGSGPETEKRNSRTGMLALMGPAGLLPQGVGGRQRILACPGGGVGTWIPAPPRTPVRGRRSSLRRNGQDLHSGYPERSCRSGASAARAAVAGSGRSARAMGREGALERGLEAAPCRPRGAGWRLVRGPHRTRVLCRSALRRNDGGGGPA